VANFKKAIAFVALLPVYFYRVVLSPLSKSCQFYPTCSLYTVQSVKRFGVVRGYMLGGVRILRCNPFNKKGGGFDPVPYRLGGGAKWVV
jgi:putative membrane protein insertion efficiency factor